MVRKTQRMLALTSLLLLAAGCTHLETTPIAAVDKSTVPAGAVYHLTMTQFSTTATWQLQSCETLNFKPSIVAKPNPVQDPAHSYVLNYGKLSGPTKIAGIVLDYYPDGTLKAVNASAQDMTGPLIKSLVSAGIGIAALASGVPLPGPALADEPGGEKSITAPVPVGRPVLVCKPAVATALASLPGLQAGLHAAAGEVEQKTEALATIRKVMETTVRPTRQARTNAETAVGDMAAAQKRLVAAQKALSDAQEAISLAKTIDWPRNGNEETGRIHPDPTSVDRLFNIIDAASLPAGSKVPVPSAYTGTNWQERADEVRSAAATGLAITLEIRRVTDGVESASNDKQGRTHGLYYRMPAKGRLVACSAPACSTALRNQVILDELVDLPQLGTLAVLPLENGPFENNSLSVSFAESGAPTKVEFKELTAPANEAAAVLDAAVGAGIRYRDASAGAELTALKRRTEEAEQANKLATALAASDPGALADIQAQTALAKANLELLQVRQALAKAQAGETTD